MTGEEREPNDLVQKIAEIFRLRFGEKYGNLVDITHITNTDNMGRVYLQFYRDQDAGVRFVVVMTESMTVAPIDLQIENWEKSTMFITLAEEILGFTTAGQFAEIINSKKRSLMN